MHYAQSPLRTFVSPIFLVVVTLCFISGIESTFSSDDDLSLAEAIKIAENYDSQIAGSKGTKRRELFDNAIESYKYIVRKYPNSKNVPGYRTRISNLKFLNDALPAPAIDKPATIQFPRVGEDGNGIGSPIGIQFPKDAKPLTPGVGTFGGGPDTGFERPPFHPVRYEKIKGIASEMIKNGDVAVVEFHLNVTATRNCVFSLALVLT